MCEMRCYVSYGYVGYVSKDETYTRSVNFCRASAWVLSEFMKVLKHSQIKVRNRNGLDQLFSK